MSARMWYDEAYNGYAVSTPHNQGFVEWIKFAIPRHDRTYDSVTKIWTIASKHKDLVLQKCRQLFGNVDFTEKIDLTPPAQVLPSSEIGEFLKLLGEEAIGKALRHAALVHHPDRGGDAAVMSRLNQLWASIKKSL